MYNWGGGGGGGGSNWDREEKRCNDVVRKKSSAESQKGINAVQQFFIENQKGDIAIDFVQW